MNILKLPATNKLPLILLGISVLLILMLSACKKEGAPEIETEIGQWRLIAALNDPGDGSGEWVDVDTSTKEIEFKEDGSFLSNLPLCIIVGIEPDTPGTYSKGEQIITTLSDCKIPYSFEEEFIILSFPCIEPCLEKYERIR